MKSIVVLFLLLSSFIFTSAFHAHGKVFSFIKTHNRSKEYEHELDSGEKFHGNTTFLFEQYGTSEKMKFFYNLLLDGNGLLHWVAFSEDDLNLATPLSKTVFPVNQTDDGIEFKDDSSIYSLGLGDKHLSLYPYLTEWDFKNVCFKKVADDQKIFHFEISSLNNGKKYVGVTYIEEEDADLSQRIRLTYQGEYVIRIDFTSEEIKSTDTFCRSISEIISQYLVLGASTLGGIDPNALKSLVG